MDDVEAMIARTIKELPLGASDKFQVAKNFVKALELRTPDFPLFRDKFLAACSPRGLHFEEWA